MARAFIRIETDQTSPYTPSNRPVIITTPVNAVVELAVDINGNNTVTIVDGDTGGSGVAVNGIPPGGTTGQILEKDSNVDFDASWHDEKSTSETEIYLIKTYISGSPIDGQLLVGDYIVNIVNWPANFVGSRFYCVTPPTYDYIISVQKNGVEIGTILFAAGNNTATFSTFGGLAQNAVDGDRIELFAPNTTDTITQIYGTLTGTRAGIGNNGTVGAISPSELYVDHINSIALSGALQTLPTPFALPILQTHDATGYAIAIGQDNTIASPSIIIGNSNTLTDINPVIILGSSNKLAGTSMGMIFGYSNTFDALEVNDALLIMGNANTITDSYTPILFGHSNTITSGHTPLVLGNGNIINNSEPVVAIGHTNTIEGSYVLALGTGNKFSRNGSAAFGNVNIVDANNILAIGNGNTITNGDGGLAIGYGNTVDTSSESLAFGDVNVITNGGQVIAFGNNNASTGSAQSVAIGNGNSIADSQVLAFGNVNIIINDGSASSGQSLAFGNGNTVDTSSESLAFGNQNIINHGQQAFAFGNSNTIIADGGQNGFAYGNGNTVGNQSFALGTGNNVTGLESYVFGLYSTISEYNSYAFGQNITLAGTASVGFGQYGTDNGNNGAFIVSAFGNSPTGFAIYGSRQREEYIFSGTASDTTLLRLTVKTTIDNGNELPSLNNVAALADSSAASFSIIIIAFDQVSKATLSWQLINGLIVRGTGVDTVSMPASNPPFVAGPATAGAPTAGLPTATADTVNGGFNISWTPPVGNINPWNVVANLILLKTAIPIVFE